MLSREEYLAAWSRWHGGTGTESAAGARAGCRWRTRWPGRSPGCRRSSRPPSAWSSRRRGVGPAAAGGAWLVAAGLLVGLSGLLDSLDGALAIGTGRASRRGFVLDSVVDRLTEVAYAAALWVAGAPGWLAVASGRCAGCPTTCGRGPGRPASTGPAPISVWERPTRVAMAGITLGGAGVVVRRWAGPSRGDRRSGGRGGARPGRHGATGAVAARALWPDRRAGRGSGAGADGS